MTRQGPEIWKSFVCLFILFISSYSCCPLFFSSYDPNSLLGCQLVAQPQQQPLFNCFLSPPCGAKVHRGLNHSHYHKWKMADCSYFPVLCRCVSTFFLDKALDGLKLTQVLNCYFFIRRNQELKQILTKYVWLDLTPHTTLNNNRQAPFVIWCQLFIISINSLELL